MYFDDKEQTMLDKLEFLYGEGRAGECLEKIKSLIENYKKQSSHTSLLSIYLR